MDTILYIYKKRDLERPRTEPVGLKTYLLIRIGLDVEEGRWFDKRLEGKSGRDLSGEKSVEAIVRPNASEGKTAQAGQIPAAATVRGSDGKGDCPPEEYPNGIMGILARPWRKLRLKQKERKRQSREQARRLAEEQEEARLRACREQLIGRVEEEMKRLAGEVAELAGDMESCLCVYEDSLRKALLGAPMAKGAGGLDQWEESRESGQNLSDAPLYGDEVGYLERQPREKTKSILPVLWQKYFPLEEFRDYTGRYWIEQLFRRAERSHFILLGKAAEVFPVIEAYAGRMKSLRWILTEAEYDRELADFVEDFYTEYGLAIELQLLEDWAALKRLRFFCREAVNMVDFTGENCMAVLTVPEGSIWLDMFSVEEKKRRILAREKKVAYISMKDIWKIVQKRCNCPILP